MSNHNEIKKEPRGPGDLDRTFGVDGTMDSFAPGSWPLTFVGRRADGKVLLVGTVERNDQFSFQLAQLLPDGSKDNTFGNEGIVVGTFRAGVSAFGDGAQLLNDGKIILFGYHHDGKQSQGVARFHPNGQLDTDFGDDGTALIPPVYDSLGKLKSPSKPEKPTSEKLATGPSTKIAIGPDGEIVIGQHNLLRRLDSNGVVDLSFNGKGHVIVAPVSIRAVAVSAADGKITAAGTEVDAGAVLRFNKDGTPDRTFSDDGVTRIRVEALNTYTILSALLLRPDGSFFVAGHIDGDPNSIWGTERRCLLAAFNASGTPNLVFNHGRPLISDLAPGGSCVWADLGLDSDDRLVAVGSTGRRSEEVSLLARYHFSGELDTSFGDGKGYVHSRIGIDRHLWESVVVQTDNRILATGVCRILFSEAVVACYLG
ncbi:hypothetical protein [Pseudomonas frederiksbergensis]|uniref:hypothetical protein n=1 Tax=Pseudomonas frederiksbergensis TaxID=104087 RepID=UPI003D19BB0F